MNENLVSSHEETGELRFSGPNWKAINDEIETWGKIEKNTAGEKGLSFSYYVRHRVIHLDGLKQAIVHYRFYKANDDRTAAKQ